ncbi:hypothetical protein Vadar_003065 [Vaccinium darrowii]|uniref:Uncharacterized protein n=1 Tax=Vaccinium darrowii TaxID=229202 RepID=A0ACB7XX77_9ERIC|nr:hypothetical protein Vadar_003065 [Vaccinium darrowii]
MEEDDQNSEAEKEVDQNSEAEKEDDQNSEAEEGEDEHRVHVGTGVEVGGGDREAFEGWSERWSIKLLIRISQFFLVDVLSVHCLRKFCLKPERLRFYQLSPMALFF